MIVESIIGEIKKDLSASFIEFKGVYSRVIDDRQAIEIHNCKGTNIFEFCNKICSQPIIKNYFEVDGEIQIKKFESIILFIKKDLL